MEETGSNVKESRGGWWKKNKQRKKEIELTGFRVFVFPGFRGSLLDNFYEFSGGFCSTSSTYIITMALLV